MARRLAAMPLLQVLRCYDEDVPWTLNGPDEYELACARCEIMVGLDKHAHRIVLKTLALLPARGTVLTVDLPFLNLMKFDRLEPTIALQDVQTLPEVAIFPFPVVFWRSANDTLTRHRNVLFDARVGITVPDTLTVDTLHAHYLGNLNVYCRHTARTILTSGVYVEVGTLES